MKLEISNLTAGYDTGIVLQDLSLSVGEGEFVSLLGPSGCGKTTLMKTIAGIVPARGGTVRLDGQDITRLPIHRRGVVIVFQDMRLFPHLSVAENVAFPLKMQGVGRGERLQRAEQLLEKVQMAGCGRRRPAELSGGQQQRVALARALAAQPRLLLLDEPFSALDENLREDMRQLVLSLQREFSMTVMLVTHDREEALSMSDRVALMADGRLLQVGTPRQVYRQPVSRQVADYFGNAVYVKGTVSGGGFTGGGVRFAVGEAAGNYEALLRPGDLHPEQAGDYPVTVVSVSYRGSDTLVTFRGAEGTVWKKSMAHCPWQVGQTLQAALLPEEPVLFPC